MPNRTNPGRPDGLTYKVKEARESAPDEFAEDVHAIASVAWTAFESGRDPADLWTEVANGD